MPASEPAALAAASQATTTEARVLTGEWPMSSRQDRVAERIRAHAAGGRTRHDIVLDRSYVGKLIGQRGNNLQALRQGTQGTEGAALATTVLYNPAAATFTYVALSETPAVTNSSPHTHSRYIYTDDLSPGAFKTVGEHLLLAAHKYVWCSMY